jgi:transposase
VHSQSLHSQLSYKRLEQGASRWPPISDGMMRLSASQLAALIEGLQEYPFW